MTDTEELLERIDVLLDTDVLKLRDALTAVIGELDAAEGQSGEIADVIHGVKETLAATLGCEAGA